MINKFFEVESFDFDKERKNFIDNLNFLKSMSVQEQTLYKKWQEFNKDEYKMRTKAHKFDIIKSKICACIVTSSAVVGSSAINSAGLHCKAIAIMILSLIHI